MSLSYALLPPFTFGPEFDAPAYGLFADGSDLMGPVLVQLVKSGRFAKVISDVEVDLPGSLLRNVVTEEEAIKGYATYVGSHVAVVYDTVDCSRVWTYGLCIDHIGDMVVVSRPMDKSPIRVSIHDQSICVVDLLNMCFGWASDKTISMVRLHDLLAEHQKLLEEWDGIPLSKKRNASVQASFLNNSSLISWPAEDGRLPCYNPHNGRTVWHPTGHVLDYLFYVLGGRTPPKGLKVLENLCQPLAVPTVGLVLPTDVPAPLSSKGKSKTKKSTSKNKPADSDTSFVAWEDSQALSEDDDGDVVERAARSKVVIPLINPPNQLPLTGEFGTGKVGSELTNERKSLDVIMDAIGGSSGKSFKPTSIQQMVHNNIATGKCASGVEFESPQQWAEDLQCLSDLGVLFYPGFCKGAFSFEFGRSVQIQELFYGDWIALAERSEGIDMADFSTKAKKPKIPTLLSIGDLVQCVSNLLGLADTIYQPPVCSALQRLRGFLLAQQPKWSASPGTTSNRRQ